MQCKQARNAMTQQLDGTLPAEEQVLLRQHLASCPECRSDQMAIEVLQDRLTAWKDLKPPRWERVPFMQPRRSWVRWVPALVAAAIMLMVFMKTDIRIGSDGVLIQIGDIPIENEEVAQLESRFYQTLGDIQDHQNQQYEAITASLGKLETKNANVLLSTLDRNRREQNQAMERIIQAWQRQRQKDIELLSDNIERLHLNQRQNRTDLVDLAQYVQNAPRKRS